MFLNVYLRYIFKEIVNFKWFVYLSTLIIICELNIYSILGVYRNQFSLLTIQNDDLRNLINIAYILVSPIELLSLSWVNMIIVGLIIIGFYKAFPYFIERQLVNKITFLFLDLVYFLIGFSISLLFVTFKTGLF